MKEPIDIWEPRYRDKTVLIAKFRVEGDDGVDIKISRGDYRGLYHVPAEVFKTAKIEDMARKMGGYIQVYIVPLDKLIKKEEEKE